MSEVQDLLYGLNDGCEVTLPSGKTAVVREMNGADQRNFTNRTKLMNGTATQELLANCTLELAGEPLPADPAAKTKIMLDMLSGDRATLMFSIRRYSLGDEFQFRAECPQCHTQHEWEVNLADKEAFKVTPYKQGDHREVVYRSKIADKLKIRFHHLDGHAEMTVIRKRNNLNSLTDLEARNPHIWEPKGESETEGRWVPIQLNRLPDRLLGEMRKQVREHEGGIDTTVTVICDSCSQQVVFDLIQQSDFMTPNMTS